LRRIFVVLGVAAGLVGGAWWVTRAPVPRHVILVSLDTTRADAIGLFGGPETHTPTIDALGPQSVVFERHYSAAPTTLASHTALFTGNHPHTHGVPRNDYRVNDKNRMLQEVLTDAGFTTAAFLGAMPLGSHSNFTQGFGEVDETFTMHRSEDGVSQSERSGAEVVSAALAWLDAHPPGADDRYFLFIHLFDAHAPYWPDEDLAALFHADPAVTGSMEQIGRVRGLLRRDDPSADGVVAGLRALYLAGVATVDRHLGPLLDGLAARGMVDDTLLILTADHGETWSEHDEAFDHGETVYDEAIHTPLLLRFPGGWAGGARVSEPVSNVDVFPTLLELLDLPARKTDGESLLSGVWWPLWSRSAPVFSEATKPHVPDLKAWQNDSMHKALVDGEEKLIWRPKQDRSELYDLSVDPGEQHDLKKERGARASELLQTLTEWNESAKPLPSPKVSSARVKAELEALGYAEPDAAGAP
jgi:choline-sulfatase